MRLKGQVAAVTGAAQGIGYTTASRLAADGAVIAVIDINAAAADAAADALRKEGAEATAFPLDVSDYHAVNATFDHIVSKLGGLHIVVNAAAVFPFSPILSMTPEEWRRVMSVNLDGTFYCCQAAFRIMRSQSYGRIVNFASGTFDIGNADLAHYVASKGGIIGFSRVLATEAGPHSITCNVVAPGVILTEGYRNVPHADDILNGALAMQPIKRQGMPSDVAEAIAYLVSAEAGFVTGQTLAIGGGITFNGA